MPTQWLAAGWLCAPAFRTFVNEIGGVMSYLSKLLGRLAPVCLLLLPLLAQAQGVFPLPEAAPELRFEVSGSVNAIVAYDDAGTQFYVIAGDFDQINGEARSNLARVDADGNLADGGGDSSWLLGTDAPVLALARDGDDLYLAGEFTAAGGQARSRAARFSLSGGVLDAGFAPNLNGIAHSVQVGAGRVFYGGAFTAPQALVAAFDTAGNLLAWNAAIEGNAVYALHLDPVNDRLYIGGQIRRIAGANRRGLGRVIASTAAHEAGGSAWNPGMQPAGGARVFSLTGDATHVYVGGQFRRFGGGVTRNNAAKLSKVSGAALDAWNPDADGAVRSLQLDAAGAIYAGGEFANIGGAARLRVAKLPDASPAAAVAGWSATADRAVVSLAFDSTGRVLVGGGFATVKGVGEGGIARLAAVNGDPDASFVTTAGGPGTVAAFAFDSAGGLIVGGTFDGVRVGTDPTYHARANLLRLNADYSLDLGWSLGIFGDVLGLDVAQDLAGDRLYIGGRFNAVNGATPRARLALIDLDPVTFAPSLNATWNPGADADVTGLWEVNGQVYVSGLFTTAGGAARNLVAQLSAVGGGAASAWNPDPDDLVHAVHSANGVLYLGGEFTVAGGQTRAGLVRVDETLGQADAGFDAQLNGLAVVAALQSTPDGLVVGGQFSMAGAEPRQNLARVDAASGAVDVGWNPWLAATGDRIDALAVDDLSGNVYVGGGFVLAGPQARSNLARVSGAGAVDLAWEPGTDLPIRQITALGADAVLIGGEFTRVTGEGRNGLALLGAGVRATTSIAIESIVPSGGVDGGPSVVGQTYTVQWSLSNQTNPAQQPTGSVLVSSSGGESCAPVAAAASGSCDLVAASSGLRTVTASFTGDAPFLDASSDAQHQVGAATISFGLAATPNPAGLADEVFASISDLLVQAPGGGTPQGSFTVTIDGGAGCTITLPDLDCSLGSFPAFDFYAIEASYLDSNAPANHVAVASATALLAVGTPTSVSLSVPPTAVIGTAVTASVTTTGIQNAEQVVISGGLGCTIDIVDGEGVCQLTFDAAGEIGVTANYAGSDERLPSEDNATVTVSRIVTSLVLSADPAMPVIGQTVLLTATTSNIPDNASVSVSNAPGCASITITANSGSCSTQFATAGPVTVGAEFAETAERLGSTGSVEIEVGKIPTSFGLQLSSATPAIGETVTVSLLAPDLPADAVVAVSGGSGCSIDRSNSDSCTLNFASIGQQPVSAVFTATAIHLGSTASSNANVGRIVTAVALTADNTVPAVGAPVVLTASTTNIPNGSLLSIANAPGCASMTIQNNAASCSTAFASAGSVLVTASFSETDTLAASSGDVSLTVAQGSTSLSLSADPVVIGEGDSSSFSWTLEVLAPASGTPSGSITVSDGNALSCSAAIASGGCSIQINVEGDYEFSASYAGDANFTGSTSSLAFVTVVSAIEPPTDADLSVSMRVLGSAYFVDDDLELVQFEVLASNLGPADATAAPLTTSIDPAAFADVTWTCAPAAACSVESGVGDPSLTLDLGNGSGATVLILATVRADAPSPAQGTASIAVPGGLDDPQLANNSASTSYQTCSFSVVESATPDPLVLPVHLCAFRDSFEAQP